MSKVNIINSRPPPQKCRQLGTVYCKGICDRYKSPKPNWGKDPYETHSYCRRCGGVWMKKEDTIKSRCPCCNWQVANKSRKRTAMSNIKRKYVEAV
jgi:ribosomal protein L37E